MSDPSTLFDDIAADVAAGLQRQGDLIVAAVRQDLSVPVGTRRGPRGGRLTTRSRPGEPPRMETGRLRAGVTSSVTLADNVATLTVTDPVAYASPLQGPKLARIVTSTVPDRFTDQVADAVASAARDG